MLTNKLKLFAVFQEKKDVLLPILSRKTQMLSRQSQKTNGALRTLFVTSRKVNVTPRQCDTYLCYVKRRVKPWNSLYWTARCWSFPLVIAVGLFFSHPSECLVWLLPSYRTFCLLNGTFHSACSFFCGIKSGFPYLLSFVFNVSPPLNFCAISWCHLRCHCFTLDLTG